MSKLAEEKRIAEGNQLIALFMGAIVSSQTGDFINCIRLEHPELPEQRVWSHEFHWKLQYHGNWNWLMAVIEKIAEFKYEDGDRAYPRTFGMISEINKMPMVRINRMAVHTADTLKKAAWLAAIDFIKWYNENKK